MYNPISFKKKLLATTIASLAATTFTAPTFAQADAVEEILVSGIRGSLTRSMDVKRESSGVVDAINSEDMGKFPDTNLAESLQRITGVSISRADGEGSRITVRGFGDDYNTITLNGRTLPGGGVPANGGLGSSRGFDFANLASEAITAVEVYKTGKANISSGGIGASINIKTNRPLEATELTASVGVKLVNDTTNRVGDDVTPEISGIFSWADDSEMFGVGLSASHQERDSSSTGAYVTQWNTRAWAPGAMQLATDAVVVNAPADGDLFSTPSDIRYTMADRERTRDNAQLVLQFKPVDNLTGTLDYTYAKNDLYESRAEQSLWFIGVTDAVAFDDDDVKTPVIYSEEISGGKDLGLAVQERNQVNELESIGFNVNWDATDNFNVALDYHDSTNNSEPSRDGISWINFGMGAPVVGHQSVDFRPALPIMNVEEISDAATNNNGQLDAGDVSSQVQQISSSWQESGVEQIKLDGKFTFDGGSFQFGVESRTNTDHAFATQSYDVMGDWGIANPGDIPDDLLSLRNFPAAFDDYGTNGAFDIAYVGSAAELSRWAEGEYGNPSEPSANFVGGREIEEDVSGFYFQVDVEGELAGMSTNVVAGVRYETTDITSESTFNLPQSITWLSNNDFRLVTTNDAQAYKVKESYDNLLPNFDFSINVTEDIKSRFSFSKTIGRTTWDNLNSAVNLNSSNGGVTGVTMPGITNAAASAGNPGLVPLESDNLDLSVEWYYGEASYASFTLFEKRVDNFVGKEPIEGPLFDLKDATSGPRAQAARAALEARSDHDGAITETELFTMVVAMENGLDYDTVSASQASLDALEAAYDVIPNSSDPLFNYKTTTPVNNREAKIYGLETGVQHFFGETGFGIQANYTVVKGDIGFDNLSTDTQFALTGLSDTANLVLIYENFGLSTRLAYNWRDKYLDNTAFFSSEPRYFDAYTSVDLNVSYELTDNLQVSFEGLNITEENTRSYGRSERQLWTLEDLGARYQIGARYIF